ncbi:MAG: sugar ABC transporter permease [Clostridia bacterium]|nr:sugar ABC transporter permease [Clostridia bacterium]
MKKTNEIAIPEVVAEARKHKWKRLGKKIWEYKLIYFMMLPVIISYLLFSYYPMYGILLAWKEKLSPSKGILGSKWADPLWHNFTDLFKTQAFLTAIKNTLVISLLKICFMFPAPIVVGLLMNECKAEGYKKGIQTVIYLPNFLSWVIIGTIVKDIFGYDGVISSLREMFGIGSRVDYMENSDMYYFVLIAVSIIKETGWNTIIYMAAISAVSPTLYEAGTIDGCGRFRLMWNVTIPCIMPVIILQFLLAIGNIMNAGFDAVFNTYREDTWEVSDILDTYIYREGILQATNWPFGTAAGLFKSIINFALLMTANTIVKKINGQGIYDLGD